MMRKGVLIIGNHPPPFGGVPVHIEYLSRYLVEKNWDVHVLTGKTQPRSAEKNGYRVYSDGRSRKQKRVDILRFFFKTRKIAYLRFFRSIRSTSPDMFWFDYMSRVSLGGRIIEGNDIKVISAYNLHRGATVGAILSSVYKLPLVVTNFGEIYDCRDFLTKHMDMFKFSFLQVTRFLAMSQHCADGYRMLGLNQKVDVVPYGVDVQKFTPRSNGSMLRKLIGGSQDDTVVLFIGRMVRDMGLHTLLEAIPEVLKADHRVQFVIAGAKGDLTLCALNLSKSHKNRIFVFPDVSPDELPLFYGGSDILVVPTRSERACGSLAAIEAMASGVPVIASRIGGIPEIIEDGKTGMLIKPEDPSELSRSILCLFHNKETSRRMGKLGRERAKNIYDKELTSQKIENIFEELSRTRL